METPWKFFNRNFNHWWFFNGVLVVLYTFFFFFFKIEYSVSGRVLVTEQSLAVQLLGPTSATATPDSALRLSDAAPGGADFAARGRGVSRLFTSLHRSLDALGDSVAPLACPHLPSRLLGPSPPCSPPVFSPRPGSAAFPAASPLLSRHRANESRVDLKCFSLFLEML